MFVLALEGTSGLMFWTGCGCIPPVRLGAVAFELCLFATEAYDAIIDPASSVLKIKPGRTMTTPPKTPEELRRRHRRIGLAWEMVRSKHMNRSWLPERCTDAFRKLSDHVLGPRIADLRSGDGRAPAWSLVLQYEAELRKHAYKFVRDAEAADLASALTMACKAPDIMNNFFIVPFTMQVRAPALEVESVVAGSSGGGKGKGKGKSKGKPAPSGAPKPKKEKT